MIRFSGSEYFGIVYYRDLNNYLYYVGGPIKVPKPYSNY